MVIQNCYKRLLNYKPIKKKRLHKLRRLSESWKQAHVLGGKKKKKTQQ